MAAQDTNPQTRLGLTNRQRGWLHARKTADPAATGYVPAHTNRTEGEIVSKRLLLLLCTALALGVLVAACGGDDSGGGGTAGTSETGSTSGVKAVDPASMDNAKGTATYCSGKDTSGDLKETIAE